MWCSYHKTTTHNGVDCRARPANGLNGNALFAQVHPPSVRGICSSWDLPVRDDSDEKPCILFMAREAQPAAKHAKARVEEKGARPSDPVSTAATGGRRTRPWSFTPRAEPIISLGGPVAEKTFGMANDEEPVRKALGASPSVAVTSEDSVNSNLATLMVDSGASGHYFDDAIIRDRKRRLQDYVHLTTPGKILTAGGAMLDGTAKGVLQGLATDDNGNQIFVRVGIVVVPGIGRNLLSMTTAAKKGIAAIFNYENPRLEEFNVTVPLRIESGDLYSFVMDLSADRYGAKELAMNAVANAQVWQRRLGHLHAQSLDILRKQDGTGIAFEGAVSDCDVCAVGKAQQLAHPKTANHKISRPFQLCYGNLMGPFTLVPIDGYKYVSKITDEYTKWTAVYLLNNKNQTLKSLQLFVGSTVILFGGRIVRWRADKTGEYTGEKFRQYCLETGIIQEFAATNTPQQIGVSEGVRRTLCAMVRCMLADSGFPSSMWGEPFMAAAYLKNRTPHKALKMETPFKMLHGEEADLSHLRVI